MDTEEEMTARAIRQEPPPGQRPVARVETPPPPSTNIPTVHGTQHEPAPDNPVTVALRNHRALLESLVPKSLSIETVVWEAYWASQQNKDLLRCTPESLVRSTARCLQLGLIIGVTGHLVPFGNVCTFIADYKGLIEIVVRTGMAASVEARPVYKSERFVMRQGLDPVLEHEPRISKRPNDPMLGAYVLVRFGTVRIPPRFEYMPLERIESVRKKSKSWGPDKVTECPDWYACKTVIRYVMKFLPQTNERQRALAEAMREEEVAELGEEMRITDDAPEFQHTERSVENAGEPPAPEGQSDDADLPGDDGDEASPYDDQEAQISLTYAEAEAVVVKAQPLGSRADARLREIRQHFREKMNNEGVTDRWVKIAVACTVILEQRAKDKGGQHG